MGQLFSFHDFRFFFQFVLEENNVWISPSQAQVRLKERVPVNTEIRFSPILNDWQVFLPIKDPRVRWKSSKLQKFEKGNAKVWSDNVRTYFKVTRLEVTRFEIQKQNHK